MDVEEEQNQEKNKKEWKMARIYRDTGTRERGCGAAQERTRSRRRDRMEEEKRGLKPGFITDNGPRPPPDTQGSGGT